VPCARRNIPCESCGAHKCSATLPMIMRANEKYWEWKTHGDRRENKMQNTTKQAVYKITLQQQKSLGWISRRARSRNYSINQTYMWIRNWRDCWSCAHGVFIDWAESMAGGLVLRLVARRESQALFCETSASHTLLIRDLIYLIEHRETDGDLLQTVSFESGHAAEECHRRTVWQWRMMRQREKNDQPVRLTTKEITHQSVCLFMWIGVQKLKMKQCNCFWEI
jgi:hypothetical protein